MKKALVIVIALSLVLAGVAMATVVSTKHDMRDNVPGKTILAFGSNTSQVCVFCHHPHRGPSSVSTVLLWNISDAANTYATYDSPTMNSTTVGDNVSTTANSAQYTLLCMGCHDGGSGNAFVRSTNLGAVPTFGAAGSTASNLGATLADDHPVDFTYPTGSALEPDIAANSGGKVAGKYPLFESTMQCATCHAVHDGQTAEIQFMRGSVANSTICRDCHTSK